MQLLYLRRVHAYCYYGGEAYEDERMLASKCGPAYVRSASTGREVRMPGLALNNRSHCVDRKQSFRGEDRNACKGAFAAWTGFTEEPV